MRIMTALEGITSLNGSSTEEISFEQLDLSIMETMEMEFEVEEALTQAVELENQYAAIEQIVDFLENAKDVISEHGLSKGIVKLIDSEGELREAGLFPAIESVNDVPTKDAAAEAALEGVGEALRKAWDAILNWIKSFAKWVADMFSRFFALFKSQEGVIKGLIEKLKNKEYDDEKAKEKKIKTVKNYKLAELAANLKGMSKNLSSIESMINKDVEAISENKDKIATDVKNNVEVLLKAFGIELEVKSGKLEIKSDKNVFKDLEEKNIKDVYGKVNDIVEVLKEVQSALLETKKAEVIVKSLTKMTKNMESFVKKHEKDDDKKALEDAKAAREAMTSASKLASTIVNLTKNTASMAIKHARAALACSK